MKVRDSIALDEIIAAAEAIDDPHPRLADELVRQLDAHEITERQYVLRMGAYCLALAVWHESEPA